MTRDMINAMDWARLFSNICRDGHLDILTFLHETMGFVRSNIPNGIFARWQTVNDCIVNASYCGHADVLHYLQTRMGLLKSDVMAFNGLALENAIQGGWIESVQYLVEGFGVDSMPFGRFFTLVRNPDPDSSSCSADIRVYLEERIELGLFRLI